MLREARLLVDTRSVVTVWAERLDLAIVAVQALTATSPSLPAVDHVAPRGSPKNSQGALAALVRGAVLHMPQPGGLRCAGNVRPAPASVM